MSYREGVLFADIRTTPTENSEWREITTPYLDDANDCIQIYAKRSGSTFRLTDDGATVANLKMAGVQIHAATRTHLQQILNEYGVVLLNDELVASGPLDSFEEKKSLLVQAILEVIRAGQLMRIVH